MENFVESIPYEGTLLASYKPWMDMDIGHNVLWKLIPTEVALQLRRPDLPKGPIFLPDGIVWASRGLAASLRQKNPSKQASAHNSLDAVKKLSLLIEIWTVFFE